MAKKTAQAAASSSDFDAQFETGAPILPLLDLASAKRPGLSMQRVNVDFPTWEVQAMDREADRMGITRQALIKVWIAERLDGLQRQANRVASVQTGYKA